MGRLLGKQLWETMTDEERKGFSDCVVTMRYVKWSKSYELRMWRWSLPEERIGKVRIGANGMEDMVGYRQYEKRKKDGMRFAASSVSGKLSDSEWAEIDAGDCFMQAKIVTDKNKYEDVDDDTYADVSIAMYKCWLTARVLEIVRREAHKYALGRVLSPWVALEPRYHHRMAKKAVSENIEHKDAILEKSARRGDIETYVAMCYEMGIHKRKEAEKRFYKQRSEMVFREPDNKTGA